MHSTGAYRPQLSLRRIDCVNTLIVRPSSVGEDVLLVWNADWKPPEWSLPGGSRECSESLVEAAIREIREETGLIAQIDGLLDVHEKIGLGGRIHLVVFTFAGHVTGGELILDGRGEPEEGGVSHARWAPISECTQIPKVSRVLQLPRIKALGATCTCDKLRNSSLGTRSS